MSFLGDLDDVRGDLTVARIGLCAEAVVNAQIRAGQRELVGHLVVGAEDLVDDPEAASFDVLG